MSIQTASWADFGFRRLGPLPALGAGQSTAQVAAMLKKQGDYEVNCDLWIRRYGRKKESQAAECIQLVDVLDKSAELDNDRLRFLEVHARSEWAAVERDVPHLSSPPELPAEAVKEAENVETPRWYGLYRLIQALCHAGPERLRATLRQHVAPCFFRLYPQGKIVVLRNGMAVERSAAALRLLYAMAQAPLSNWNGSDFVGVRTLQDWHMTTSVRLLPALLNLFNYLFYPQVGGVCACPPGLTFVFLLDPPEQHTLASFPRNWLAFPTGAASFGKERFDLVEVVLNSQGVAHERASHQRFWHKRTFTSDERLGLLRWFIARVNRLLYELTDATNFTAGHDPQEVLDPVFGFEHQLTVDRLLRKTLLATSLDDAPTANLMAFEIADLYDTLASRFGLRTSAGVPYKQTEFFKALFNTQEGPALIKPRFAGLPAPFDAYFADVTTEVYAKIEQAVIASVWLKAKLTTNGVLVRDKSLTTESTVPVCEFVGEVMRAYRNAHHGYFSSDPASQNRPSRLLFPVDGNLPVEMSALPVLWWLAYLADPGLVGWKHLEIGAYD